MGYFEEIITWLQTAGVKPVSFDNKNEESIKKFELLKSFILEEFEELKEAFNNNDKQEFNDALVDLIWMIMNGVAFFDLEDIFFKKADQILKSNQSKFCFTKEVAEETVRLYREGLHPTKKGEKIITYYEKIGKFYVVKRQEDDKILKSMYYKEPVEF